MTIAFFVGGTVFYGFTALFEPLVEEFGWSYTKVSFAASLRGLEMGFFAPIVGWLVDRWGPRRLMLCGIIVMGAGFLLLSATRNLAMFYGSMILLSFGAGGCTSIVTMSAVANWFHRKIGLAFGIMASGFGLSGLIVPLLVMLIDSFGWRQALIVIGLSFFVMGIPIALVIRDKPEDSGWHPDGISPTKNTPSPQKDTSSDGKTLLRFAILNRSFLLLCLAEAVRLGILMSLTTHIMPFLATMAFERKIAGIVAAAVPLLSVIGRFSFGWLSDSVPKNRLLSLSYCFICLGMLSLRFIHIKGMLFVFLILFPIGFGGGLVLRGAIIRDYFGRERFGRLVGVVMGFSTFGSVLGPTITGYVFDHTGNYDSVWMIFALLSALTAIIVFSIKKTQGGYAVL